MLNLIAELAPLLFSVIQRIVAERAAVQGKSEGVLLREALVDVDESDRRLVATLVKLLAKKQGDPRAAAGAGQLLSDLDRASELIAELRAKLKTEV